MIINNENLDAFTRDLERVTKELEKKYQVSIKCGSISYDNCKFSVSVKVSNVTASGITQNTQRALDSIDWFRNIYGKTFVQGRHSFKVVGYEYGKKYSINCVRDDGESYSFSNSIVDGREFK